MDPSEILDVNMLSPGDIILAHDLLKYRSSQDDLINVDKLLKFYKMHTDDIQFSIYFEPDLINNIKSKSMLELFLSYGIDNPYFPYINFLSSSRPDLNRIVFNYMKTHIRDRERLWNFIENLAFNAKLINDNCEILLEAIDFFEFDRDKTLNKLQGYQPTPICKISRKYSSGRGYLIPKQISAFGNIELPLLNFSQMNIITNKDFINNEYCFCANISWGI